MSRPARLLVCFAALAVSLAPGVARAGIADTVPQGIVVVDAQYISSEVDGRFDGNGKKVDLAEPVERFSPTGEFQGNLLIPGVHSVEALVTKIAVGVTDELTAAVVIPYFISQKTELNLDWEPGEFIPEFNRVMSGDDFWEWAGGLGQPKPPDWEERGRLGDVILAIVYNFVRTEHVQLSAFAFGSTFTSEEADPEELGAVGTSGYDLITNGDLGIHLLSDFKIPDGGPILDRLTLSAELFYEHFFERTFDTPIGTVNPLILREAPFVGSTYKVKRGDLHGAAVGFRVDLIQGRSEPTWLTRNNPALQESFPAALGFSFMYKHMRSADTDYTSRSAIWDSEKEEENAELYKNSLRFQLQLSLLRYGIPVDLAGGYFNQEWIAGQNFRPANQWDVSLRLYYSVLVNPFDLIFGGGEGDRSAPPATASGDPG